MAVESRIKVAWITGASSGIGEALAQELSNHSYHIILSARNEVELNRVLKLCNTQIDHFLLPFDLTDSSAFPQVVEKAFARFGQIDILINNGGVSQRASVDNTSIEVVRTIMEVNFFSHALLTKLALPYFRKQSSAKIVVMSSLAGKFGFFLRSGYSASKHALHGYFEALRLEEQKNNISVLIVCPGYIKTSISVNALDALGNKHSKKDQNQEQGMEPNLLAKKVYNSILNNKREILIGGKELVPAYLKRFFPALFFLIMARIDPREK